MRTVNLTFIMLEQRRVQVAEDIALVYDAGPANNGVHWRWDHLCEIIDDPGWDWWEEAEAQGLVEPGPVQKRVAPYLSPAHVIEQGEPLTIGGSLLCLSCGLHGFVRDGKWVTA